MENGSYGVSTTDVGVLAGLRGVDAYGYGGNFPGDGSAIKEAIRGNRDISLLSQVNEGTRDQLLVNQIDRGHSTLNDRITTGNQFLTDRIAAQSIDFKFQNISDQLASAERLAFANNAALERTLASNQAAIDRQLHSMELKQVECCCELKAGQSTIIANQESARLADAHAENQALRTQIMISNSNTNTASGRPGNS